MSSIVSFWKMLYLVLDSTGLKVYGKGEWKVRQHGYSKRRTWLKLHLVLSQAYNEKAPWNIPPMIPGFPARRFQMVCRFRVSASPK